MWAGFSSLYHKIHYIKVRYIKVWVYLQVIVGQEKTYIVHINYYYSNINHVLYFYVPHEYDITKVEFTKVGICDSF